MPDLFATKPDDDSEDDSASSSEDAASDILAAVKASDAKALNLALQRHYESCQDSESEPDDDTEA